MAWPPDIHVMRLRRTVVWASEPISLIILLFHVNLLLDSSYHIDRCVKFVVTFNNCVFVVCTVQTGGAVHVLPQAPSWHASEDPWLLRTPLSGQDVWRGKHFRGAERTTERGQISSVLSWCWALTPRIEVSGFLFFFFAFTSELQY